MYWATAMSETSLTSGLTIRDLRRRWKPHKQRLSSTRSDHPTLIRFHRACSWLARVEKMDLEQDGDLALVGQAMLHFYGEKEGFSAFFAGDERISVGHRCFSR